MTLGTALVLIAAGLFAYYVGRRLNDRISDVVAKIPSALVFATFVVLLATVFVRSGNIAWSRFLLYVVGPIVLAGLGWMWSRRLTSRTSGRMALNAVRASRSIRSVDPEDFGPNQKLVEAFLHHLASLSTRDWRSIAERLESSTTGLAAGGRWIGDTLAHRALRNAGREEARMAAAFAVADIIPTADSVAGRSGPNRKGALDEGQFLLIEDAAATAAEAVVVSDRLGYRWLRRLYLPFETAIPLRDLGYRRTALPPDVAGR